MPIKIANAPCSWGVDYADSKDNPGWEKVIKEISDAGYYYSELGPFGYLPKDDAEIFAEEILQRDLTEELSDHGNRCHGGAFVSTELGVSPHGRMKIIHDPKVKN